MRWLFNVVNVGQSKRFEGGLHDMGMEGWGIA